ncbi:MAG: 50S ribosomal protein L28 [Ignavibacteriales bacterium]|nr:50S ribosomal protein L28 [Ignavibacteriales bacterium]
MSRTCQVTGVKPKYGSSISHAHNHTKEDSSQSPEKRIWVQELNRFVTVKLTANAIKTIAKNGTAVIAQLVREKKNRLKVVFSPFRF